MKPKFSTSFNSKLILLEIANTFIAHTQLVLVNPLGEVMEKLERAEETRDFVKPDSLYLTVGEAVASLSLSMKAKPLPMYDEEAQANPF